MARKSQRLRRQKRINQQKKTQEEKIRSKQVDNSVMIEELKTKNPEPAIEGPVVLEEPKFMTEAEPVKVVMEEPKVEVKKTKKKRSPRKTTTRAKKK